MKVRKLTPADASAWLDLRKEMLLDTPHSFLASPEDDSVQTVADVEERLRDAPNNVIVGAFEGETLVGAVGVFRETKLKSAHRAWIWGVYLTPSARGGGVATEMIEAGVEHARTLEGVSQVCLSVSAIAPRAQALYERCGFEAWGTEPRAMIVDGELLDEVHMVKVFE